MVGTSLESFDFYVFAYFSAFFVGPLFFDPLGEFGRTLAAFSTIALAFIVRPDRRGDLRPHGRPPRPSCDPALDRRHHGRRDRPHRPAAHLRAGRVGRRRPPHHPARRAGPLARRRMGRLDPPRDRALRAGEARLLRGDPPARLPRRLDPVGRAVHRDDDRAPARGARRVGLAHPVPPRLPAAPRLPLPALVDRRDPGLRRSSPRAAATASPS